ncbi:MAG: hypothetical protein ACRDKU_02975 [Gaiellaceae bacterium]
MRWGWERLAALAGIVAVALWIIGGAIQESIGGEEQETPAGVLSYYQEDTNAILASGFIFQLGALFFLLFLSALRSRLWSLEGGTGMLATLAFASGVAVAIFLLALPAADMSGAINEDEIGADAAQALSSLDDVFFIGAELSASVLLFATGLLAVRRRALPAWLGWASFVIALWLLIPPIGWAGLLLGVPLWVLVTSVLLYLRPLPAPPPGTA